MIKGITHAHLGPIWYHSEPSDVTILQTIFLVGTLFKGQLISKCLFGVFNFLQKMNKNKSTWGFIVKVAFFKKYDAFFSLPKKYAENYPEKDILKLCSV
jgi:hypothetical protein